MGQDPGWCENRHFHAAERPPRVADTPVDLFCRSSANTYQTDHPAMSTLSRAPGSPHSSKTNQTLHASHALSPKSKSRKVKRSKSRKDEKSKSRKVERSKGRNVEKTKRRKDEICYIRLMCQPMTMYVPRDSQFDSNRITV